MPANENGCEVAVTDHTRLWLGDGRSLARLSVPIRSVNRQRWLSPSNAYSGLGPRTY